MIDVLANKTNEFSFFQAVLLLEKHYQLLPGSEFVAVGENKYFRQERIAFSVSPNLCFPKSDMEFISHMERADEQYSRIETNFLGLHGSSSPLPANYTEKLVGRDIDDNPVKDFFDFFHNRYTSLIYRVWKKYRYHVQYQSGAADKFSGRILHLAGLSNVIQESEAIGLDRAKILSYVNQLSTRTRSPKLISGIVAHYFSLPSVRIEEWIFRRVNIAECQRNQLNRMNCTLGSNLHLGKSIPDLNGKFNLCIDNIDFETYRKFSYGEELHTTLVGLMRFILRDPMSWDLRLTVDIGSIPKNQLGQGNGASLGQTLWLGQASEKDAKIRVIGGV
ncbi:type VI secretion system baseplate subunit TssG [Vibrio sp. SNU_ST1]|uniref:type VI secretion system baseplate subunit TssG n=1 Tax=unclassified Vibrio TaxID=2614977 RepID=UPI00272AAB97|nr:type VI secretion system baseplate subunit TssG [Vibrio sp. SNU_ST1]WKY59631.1 type VI secretion system baseplate subunit TssG [Vibrio sp. SNU_ST1]